MCSISGINNMFWFRSVLHGSTFDFIWFRLILPDIVSGSPDSSVLSASAWESAI
ncbi:hypothetical protein Tco_1162476, partial [Tanacetum coccineum]